MDGSQERDLPGRTAASKPSSWSGRLQCLADDPRTQLYAPILCWLPRYKREDLSSDVTAGTVVAIMLIPQAMAYALLAGLPPQYGLYASILPLIVYAIFGTSQSLGMGPVAIVSLMVASTLMPLAPPQSAEYAGYAVLLSLLSGVILLCLGMVKAGFFTNFMSHPVIAGFTGAAALIIAVSQLDHLLGISLDRSAFIPKVIWDAVGRLGTVHWLTLAISTGSLALLFGRYRIGSAMRRAGLLDDQAADLLAKAMPLVLVVVSAAVVWHYDLESRGVKVVGTIPQGLPAVALPSLDLAAIEQLFVGALLIAIIGFLESVSVARTLASRRRQKIVPDQELIAIGAANIASSLTGGYPVAGSFSRSVVNFTSGARTQLSGIVTVVFVVLTLLLLTPALYYLPRAALAAIIVVAVSSLVDFRPVGHMWRYMKLDAVSFLATFAAVLILGVEEGILTGVALSIIFFLWRTSQLTPVVLGRLGDTMLFRDARYHEVTTYDNILMLRTDMSLYFANAAHLEDFVLRYIADHPKVQHFVLVCSSVNIVDASALETLESLQNRLRGAGVTMHLAAVKSSILRRLRAVNFFEKLEPGRVFLSPHDAAVALSDPVPPPAAEPDAGTQPSPTPAAAAQPAAARTVAAAEGPTAVQA